MISHIASEYNVITHSTYSGKKYF